GGSELRITQGPFWLVILILFMNVISLELLRRGALIGWRWIKSTEESKLLERPFFFFLYVLLFLGGLYAYAMGAFPTLSPAIGGGKKQKVEFILRASEAVNLEGAGFTVDSQSRMTQPLDLIFEMSDAFIIALGESHPKKTKAVRIRKDAVDVVF